MRKDALKQDLPPRSSSWYVIIQQPRSLKRGGKDQMHLTMERMLLFRELYLGSRNSPAGEHWTASPIRAPLDLLRKCPETLIMIAGQDLLRGETFRFAWRLQEANVPVDIREYKGAPQPRSWPWMGYSRREGGEWTILPNAWKKNLAKVLGGFRRKTERRRQRV